MAGEVYGEVDPTEMLHLDEPIRIRKRGSNYVLTIRLPFTERHELDIFRKADELYVRVGPYKRNLILPQTLQRLDVREASFVDDRLEVLFGRESKPAVGSTGG